MTSELPPSKELAARLRKESQAGWHGDFAAFLAQCADALDGAAHEPPAVPKCPECGARPADQCGRSFMPGRCPMEGDALRAAERIAQQCELHGEQDPFTADLRTLVAAVRAAQPPSPALPEYTHAIGEAAETYLKSRGGDPLRLPGGFYWMELWDAMCRAALTKPAAPMEIVYGPDEVIDLYRAGSSSGERSDG